ncbi:MAG: hypothetical protein DSY60_01055 [Persephonella sp.]|nr:MAG: hypothetical protein DSY60_01055 [Persephonella sp.]
MRKFAVLPFLLVGSLYLSTSNVYAEDNPMDKIKRKMEETKAKHYQRRGGVHGRTMYIYNANKRIKATSEGGVSVFKTKINQRNLRGRKIQVQHYIENVKIKQRGVFKRNPRLKKKEIYTRDLNNIDRRVKKVIIIDKNIKVDIRNRNR